MAKNANHFLAATLTAAAAKTSKPNVEKYFWKAAKLSQSNFTMSSALGMNLMPPTSAFQHGLQQATSAAVAQQSQQSSETNLDRVHEHEPSSQDSAKAQLAAEHKIAAAATAAASGEHDFVFFILISQSHISKCHISQLTIFRVGLNCKPACPQAFP